MKKLDYLAKIEEVIAQGPYTDTWESLATHPTAQWYKDSKLGIFIHWGVYSVPAYFNEWYPRLMYYKHNPVYYHHIKKYGKDFDYHKFVPQFTAERFNPEDWLDMLDGCGADFVMPVGEHHDGFKMYKSELNRWNAYEMGPKRDILQEIKDACNKRNIKFAVSSHRAEHYWFMNGGRTLNSTNAVNNEEYRDFYGESANAKPNNDLAALLAMAKGITPTQDWLEDWLVSSCEIVDRYCPAASYFDFWTANEAFRPYMRKFLAYYYNTAHNQGKDVVSFYKMDAALYPCGVYVKERGQIDGISPDKWQCETSTAYNAWSYCTTNKFKKVEEIACNMVDVWSKNGCMALNIGPKSDGTICNEEVEILKTLAQWTQKNKEAIWGTQVFRNFGEGKKQKSGAFSEKYKYTAKDFRFTYKLGQLYAFALVPYGKKQFCIKSLSHNGTSEAIVKGVSLIGYDNKVSFTAHKSHLEINLDTPIQTTMPICFRIEVI